MKSCIKNLFLAVLFLLLYSELLALEPPERPRNVIVMIGDGMGVAHITAGRTFKGKLELENFKHMGLLLTHIPGEKYVGESAGGASAISCGVKTYYGIAVHPDGTAAESVMEVAQAAGKGTGVIVTCSITHATPAAFVAHVKSRKMEFEIAEQIATSKMDLLLGGGWGWFLPESKGGRRKDGKDLIGEMESGGFTFVKDEEAFRQLKAQPQRKILGLFAENHVGNAQSRRPSLKEKTAFALSMFEKGKNGFVLMIEGSQIDWAAHDNNSDQILLEMADFDDAVGVAIDFVKRNPETLLIVAADHETGGYALNDGSLENKTVVGKFTTAGHTGSMVPIFAMGVGADAFTGIYDNTMVGKKLLEMLKGKRGK